MTTTGDYPVLEYGGTVVLPTDRPYHQQCCDCGLVHDLHASITDDGEIALQVYRNDQETESLRRQADNRPLITDAQPRKATTMTRREERRAQRAQRAADRANQIVEDGTVLRVPLMMQDAAMIDDLHRRYAGAISTLDSAGNISTDALDMCRPGYRFGDRSASEQARAEATAQLCDAWRTPEPGVAPKPTAGAPAGMPSGDVAAPRSRFMTADEAQPIRDAAYREYCERPTNEWRPKP